MSTPVPHSTAPGAPSCQARVDLFLISLLILFLELSCIRWFPAHVLFLTFFTNTMLLACFLGMSVGCLAAGRRQDYLVWTPLLLAMALASALLVDTERRRLDSVVDVGHQNAPQLVFFGVDFQSGDPSKFVIPNWRHGCTSVERSWAPLSHLRVSRFSTRPSDPRAWHATRGYSTLRTRRTPAG